MSMGRSQKGLSSLFLKGLFASAAFAILSFAPFSPPKFMGTAYAGNAHVSNSFPVEKGRFKPIDALKVPAGLIDKAGGTLVFLFDHKSKGQYYRGLLISPDGKGTLLEDDGGKFSGTRKLYFLSAIGPDGKKVEVELAASLGEDASTINGVKVEGANMKGDLLRAVQSIIDGVDATAKTPIKRSKKRSRGFGFGSSD